MKQASCRPAARLVLAPIRCAADRSHLAGFRGDIGIDTTAVASWAPPPRTGKHLARWRSVRAGCTTARSAPPPAS
ncbi:hypothetical protein FHS43_004392 [Streptosporangium becharense]|uniref:Uncharacterized protein n=1 Tax=Streptosporangium becharense TaxID=1816182 RepID=A0A7W9IJX6_9ACTN|nr:hypothetical protein [Streptosporangium becharense]MBB2913094.1 hypothetical protein [Streptosporangium becharense]MBB5822077.1 hypothetical protein [Streptosporangium becharense]